MKEWFLKRFLPIVIVLAIGVAVSVKLMKSKPETRKQARKTMSSIVQVMEAKPKQDRVVVEAMGTVMPARRISIQPEVAGKIKEIHPHLVPGGLLKEGEVLLKIDDRDYVAAKNQAWAQVEEAQAALDLEEGMQNVARKEHELMQKMDGASTKNSDLALREPQFKQAKARLSSAYAAYKKARLNLERTEIKVPWNAVVLSKDTETGQFVSQQSRLATLAGTDVYWVEATLRSALLPWIHLPGPDGKGGSEATVVYNSGNEGMAGLSGKVIKLLADMDPKSRMARLLIEVKDPLKQLKSGAGPDVPLLLNSYVRINIKGKKQEGVYSLPRKALREGDRVWIMNDEKRLEIKDVRVAWKTEEKVMVTAGLEKGDKVITSRIISPLPGMELTLEELEESAGETGPSSGEKKKTRNKSDQAPRQKGDMK